MLREKTNDSVEETKPSELPSVLADTAGDTAPEPPEQQPQELPVLYVPDLRNQQKIRQLNTNDRSNVYKVTLHDGTVIAVKIINPGNLDSSSNIVAEVALLRQLRGHTNIVQITGIVLNPSNDQICGFAMEYCKQDLYNLLYAHPDIDWSDRLGILKDIASALAYLHERNIIHRDIKPENVLIRRNPDTNKVTAKVSDFEFAGLPTELLCGTACYIDPDYYTFREATPNSDIYAFAILMWQLMQHNIEIQVYPPYENGDITSITLVQVGKRPDIPKYAGFPFFQTSATIQGYIDLMRKNWSRDPDNRPSAQKNLETLQNLWTQRTEEEKALLDSTAQLPPAAAFKDWPHL